FLGDNALYGYKERETPKEFCEQLRDESRPKLEAFKIRTTSANGSDHELLAYAADNPGIAAVASPLAFAGATKLKAPEQPISGWYVRQSERAQFQWDNMKHLVEVRGQEHLDKSRSYRLLPFGIEQRFDGEDALWVLRGFFMGPHPFMAPPYVVVLCPRADVSKWVVDSITKHLKNYTGWYATRLPRVSILDHAGPMTPESGSDSDDEAASHGGEAFSSTKDVQPESIQIDIGQSDHQPSMTDPEVLLSWDQQVHRCGIKMKVGRGPNNLVACATIGGVVRVGERLYGLTVAHVFLQIRGQCIGQDSTTSADSANDESSNTSGIIHTWQQNGRHSMDFDWALVDLPLLPADAATWDNLNLVQTTSGDFSPVLVLETEPPMSRPVVLGTSRCSYVLRGVYVGSEAVLSIPGLNNPLKVWVLRMTEPWLLQPGDSGSWAFDASTGDLLGILVAGCPDLMEAYVIPAFEVFSDIRRHTGNIVELPKGKIIPQEHRAQLLNLENNRKEALDELDKLISPEK
ncbi:hypothetical protein QBC38DRAFT_349971, partial [Podospora fimiseda]